MKAKIIDFFQKWDDDRSFFENENTIVKNYEFLKDKIQKIFEIEKFSV